MSTYVMPAEDARTLMAALQAAGVAACVGGGWAVDALVGQQTRVHSDLDIWVDAEQFEGLVAAFADQRVDRLYPWPGDRPWNFVLHDGHSRRVDLHLYETLPGGRLHYGSLATPFHFSQEDLAGQGTIAGTPVHCEQPMFALQNHSGYELRDTDHHDITLLRNHLGLT